MGEVDLNHQSLVIGRLLYLTTSAPGIRTRELPIGKQECSPLGYRIVDVEQTKNMTACFGKKNAHNCPIAERIE